MERLEPGRGAVGAEYWTAPRARRFAAHVDPSVRDDPLLRRLRAEVRRSSSVLDVGAGTGRFAVALASRVAEVTAVDPSQDMLRVLRREARRSGATNVKTVVGSWQDVDVSPANVSICSYVLPLVEDARPFLSKLDAATRQRAFVYMNAASADLLMDPLWRHFHGGPRRPSPTYLDAVAVLREIGASPEVEVVEVRSRSQFKTLGSAVKAYRDQLILPDTVDARAELRGLLESWLIDDKGVLRPPLQAWPGAIVSWRPGSAGSTRSH